MNFSPSSISSFVLLSWDAYYAPHKAANNALIAALAGQDSSLSVLACPSYFREKHNIMRRTVYDPLLSTARLSSRQAALAMAKSCLQPVKNVFRRNSRLQGSRDNLELANVVDLCSLLSQAEIFEYRRIVRSIDLPTLLESSLYDIKLLPHWSVDLSLDCKSLSSDLKEPSPQVANLRSLFYHSLLVLHALNRYCSTGASEAKPMFLSTSVYSLDWLCREFLQNRGHDHMFLQYLDISERPACKIYHSVPDDLYLRRKLQAAMRCNNQLLSAAIKYAENYLKSRLSPKSSHTYSPILSEIQSLATIFSARNLDPGRPVWVYFTSSPDELVSIQHAYLSSGMSSVIPWSKTHYIRDEFHALEVVIEMASKMNANLIIRHHPRLWADKRSPFVSSSYRELCQVIRQSSQGLDLNLHICEPWEEVNSYELAILADKVISFRGTMPLEASLFGIKPVVLAKDQGVMNYWILDHSESSPSSMEALAIQLDSSLSSMLAAQDLSSFLIQFYLLNHYGTVRLDGSPASRRSLFDALRRGSSVSEDFASTHCVEEMPRDIDEVSARYLDPYLDFVYGLAKSAFI